MVLYTQHEGFEMRKNMRERSATKSLAALLLKAALFIGVLSAPIAAFAEANCSNTFVGLIPLIDLRNGFYQGAGGRTEQGGLYPGGANVRPTDHDTSGLDLALSIAPLDAIGNPDPNGKYVLLTIGMSNTRLESSAFITIANGDPDKDARLAIVNGAESGWSAELQADPNDPHWQAVDDKLAASGVTPQQVVAAWIKSGNPNPTGDFGVEEEKLRGELREIVRILKDRYPNIKVAYLSSLWYGGYAAPGAQIFEPYPYQSGFAVKWLIEDQINGDPYINFDPAIAPVEAPWLSWGPYLWADGLGSDGVVGGVPGRSDGLEWLCEDYKKDGGHPSVIGQNKVASILLDFLKTDTTTQQWFLANPPDAEAPSVPTNLVGKSISGTEIRLRWAASTDNFGVAGYNVFRNGALIASVATAAYGDSGLQLGTIYTYAVSAFDAVGIQSAQSSSISVRTRRR